GVRPPDASCRTTRPTDRRPAETSRAVSTTRPHVVVLCKPFASRRRRTEKGTVMAAMKPRTGDGPMEVVREQRKIVMRIPTDGGGRRVVELNDEEAQELQAALSGVVTTAHDCVEAIDFYREQQTGIYRHQGGCSPSLGVIPQLIANISKHNRRGFTNCRLGYTVLI